MFWHTVKRKGLLRTTLVTLANSCLLALAFLWALIIFPLVGFIGGLFVTFKLVFHFLRDEAFYYFYFWE